MAIAFRSIEPTWRNYIEYVGFAAKGGDESAQKFVAIYENLPIRERHSLSPEKVCDLAQVQPAEIIGSVSKHYWQHRHLESTITASTEHPKMIAATAEMGRLYVENNRDRELFFRITGSLPDKKGQSITINNGPQNATINNSSPAGANGFRPMDQRVIEMGKLLDPANESVAVPLFAEAADVLAENNTKED